MGRKIPGRSGYHEEQSEYIEARWLFNASASDGSADFTAVSDSLMVRYQTAVFCAAG